MDYMPDPHREYRSYSTFPGRSMTLSDKMALNVLVRLPWFAKVADDEKAASIKPIALYAGRWE